MQNNQSSRKKVAELITDGMDLDCLIEYVRADLIEQMEKDDKVFQSMVEEAEYISDEAFDDED